MAIRHLAFLTPGNFDGRDPAAGLRATLDLLAAGEQLGFDGGWVRQRHLEQGVSSAATVLAAATQRTQRLQLGVAVVQMGYERPLRLAEDLAKVDLLSGYHLLIGNLNRAEQSDDFLVTQGPRRTLFAPDLVGSSDQILAALQADPVLDRVTELRLELPYNFPLDDYLQILADTVRLIAPALGWTPTGAPSAGDPT